MRRDSWTNEDDHLLAVTVLDTLRAGSTQLKAFETLEGLLGRTAASCGFRWNSVVRKQYEEEIKASKEEGRLNRGKITAEDNNRSIEKKGSEANKTINTPFKEPIENIVSILTHLLDDYQRVIKENETLKEKLQKQLWSDDLSLLLKLVDKARIMTGLDANKTSAS